MWIVAFLAAVAQQTPSDWTNVVRGSVALVDGYSDRIEGTSGVLVVHPGIQGLSRDQLVPFRDGRFELRLDYPVTWIDVLSAWTALGPARIETFTASVLNGAELDIEAHIALSCSLRVLDAETGIPLDCVDVDPAENVLDAQIALEALEGSEIEIGPLIGKGAWDARGAGVWSVRAPGYVEGRVSIDRDTPRSTVIYLEHAGSIELRLVNAPSTRHTFLELESADNQLLHRDHVDPRSPLRFEGLKPGPVVVRVVHEFLDCRRVVLAETQVEIVAGVWTSAKLTAASPPLDDTDRPWEPVEEGASAAGDVIRVRGSEAGLDSVDSLPLVQLPRRGILLSPALAIAAEIGSTRPLFGRVVLTDDRGMRIENASGTFFVLSCFGDRQEREVEFSNGTYSTRVSRAGGWFEVHGARTSHGSAVFDVVVNREISGWDGELTIHGQIVRELELRVIDAESRGPLDCVDLATTGCWGGCEHDLRGLDGDSIRIDSFFVGLDRWITWDGEWRVSAPGHVEQTVRLTTATGGKVVVGLERACELEVVLEGMRPSLRTYLEIEHAESEWRHHDRIHPDRALVFDGLKSGSYVVRVVHEFLDGRRIVRGEQQVVVTSGSRVVTRLKPMPAPFDPIDAPWDPDQHW